MRILSIHVPRKAASVCLPVLDTPAFAGFPSPANDYIAHRLDLNDFLIAHPSATYYMRVAGQSMIGAGILDQDYLIVDRAVAPFSGAIVVAVLEDIFTVKRFYQQGRYMELRPENTAYQPIQITGDMELTIWGVVTGVFRKTV